MKIKKISQSIEEYLEKTIDYSKILPEEIILLRHGIKPLIISDRDSSYLGSGESAFAFDVLYQGINCVAKVTSDFRNVESLLKLFNIKNQLGDLGKHIAEVYKVIEYNEVIDNQPYIGYIILMEKLEPLDPSVSRYLFGSTYFYGSNSSIKKLIESYNLIVDIYQNPYIYFDEFKSLFQASNIEISNSLIFEICKKYSNVFVKLLIQSLNNIIDNKKDENRVYSSIIKDEILKNINNNINDFFNIFKDYKINKSILRDLTFNFAHIFVQKMVDGFSHDYSSGVAFGDFIKYKNINELKDIIKLFIFLKERFNIKFSDMHSENLMQRPGSKEIVISDAGYFQFN